MFTDVSALLPSHQAIFFLYSGSARRVSGITVKKKKKKKIPFINNHAKFEDSLFYTRNTLFKIPVCHRKYSQSEYRKAIVYSTLLKTSNGIH